MRVIPVPPVFYSNNKKLPKACISYSGFDVAERLAIFDFQEPKPPGPDISELGEAVSEDLPTYDERCLDELLGRLNSLDLEEAASTAPEAILTGDTDLDRQIQKDRDAVTGDRVATKTDRTGLDHDAVKRDNQPIEGLPYPKTLKDKQ